MIYNEHIRQGDIVSKYDRIKRKVNQGSGNLTFDEIVALLEHLGYEKDNKGRTSGSRIRFYREGAQTIIMHKPHPRKTLLDYQVKQIRTTLKEAGLL